MSEIFETVKSAPQWMKDLGEELAAVRNRKGAKQEDVAKHIGKSRQTVNKWEKGHNAPPVELLAKMCEFLGSTSFVIYGQRFEIVPDTAARKPRIVPKQLRLKLGITCSTEQATINSTRKGKRLEVEVLSA